MPYFLLPYFLGRAPSRLSCTDCGGCVTLIGSDAGKLPCRPSSSDFSSRPRLSASSCSFWASTRFLFVSKSSFSISVSFGIPMAHLHSLALMAQRPGFKAQDSTPTIQRGGASHVPALGRPEVRLLSRPASSARLSRCRSREWERIRPYAAHGGCGSFPLATASRHSCDT